LREQQHAEKRENQIKKDLTSGKQKKKEKEKTKELVAKIDISDDPVHNDFKRELLFYRQAQSAVLEALPRLKSMNIPTKRPEDYFAQMAKTDEHMQKVLPSFNKVNGDEVLVLRMRDSYKRFVKTWIRFANPWIRTVS
jgi:hypothetical protein